MFRILVKIAPALPIFIILSGVIWLAEFFGLMKPWGACGDSYLRHLHHGTGRSAVTLRIAEAPYPSQQLQKFSQSSPRIIADILQLKMVLEEEPSPSSGRIILTADWKIRRQISQLQEGDIIKADGVFLLPDGENAAGFDYASYLSSIGIRHLFKIYDFTVLKKGEHPGWLTRQRIHLAEILISGMENQPESAALALTLGLGRKEYLPRDDRQMLTEAGIIHAFAISGLHVGMVAAMLIGFLQCLACPLRLRWLVASCGICLYVTVTGFSPSAVRALAMTLLMFYAWFRQRPASALQAMGLIGITSILYQPHIIFNLGFIYSYLVVFTLVFSWPGLSHLAQLYNERRQWLPISLRTKWYTLQKMRRNTMAVFAVSLLAWITCTGLSLHNGTPVCLASPLLNIPIAILVPIALLLCFLKILTGIISPPVGILMARPLACCLYAMRQLAALTADSIWTLNVRRISATETCIYYLAWLILLCWLRNFGNDEL